MIQELRTLLALGALGALAACSSPTDTPDTGAPDTGALDAAGDAAADASDARDAPRDTRVTSDAPTGNTCNGAPIEDLAMVGMRSGTTVRFTGSNEAAPPNGGIAIPSGAASRCTFEPNRQRVFRYTTQAAGSLRISTSNMGTMAMFDTVLLAVPQAVCSSAPRSFFCNDDDPTLTAMSPSRDTSLINTGIYPAGTTFLIGVGGFRFPMGTMTSAVSEGTFELTVTEVPPIAEGAMCDRRGFVGACNTGFSCVGADLFVQQGTCQRDGSREGTACTAEATCSMGLECDPMNGICYRVHPDGMPCERFSDAWRRCGTNSTCVNLQLGNFVGTCRANGSVVGARCDAMGRCTATGLVCNTGAATPTCLNDAASGGACSTADTRCATGTTCVPTHPGQVQGTCAPNGSVPGSQCAAMNTCADLRLRCQTAATPPVCTAQSATGAVCSGVSPCAMGETCYLVNQYDRFRGRCFAPSGEGGPCAGTMCNAGLVCSAASGGRCLREVASGGECLLFGPTRCASGTTCVRQGTSTTAGRCTPNGTAAGTACLTGASRCGAGLTCSSTTGAGVCQAMSAGMCDPRYNRFRCPMGQTCQATSLDTGACAMPEMEMESNNDQAMAQNLMYIPASVQGSLGFFDVDCYTFNVPEGAALFARVNLASGFCAPQLNTGTQLLAQLGLDLYNPSGRFLGSNSVSGPFGCPMIDGNITAAPTVYEWARNLSAGRYRLCVRNPASGRNEIANYVLDVNVTGGAPPGDGGVTDGGSPDAGPSDATATDTGPAPTDTGPAPTDAGAADAGSADARPSDAPSAG